MSSKSELYSTVTDETVEKKNVKEKLKDITPPEIEEIVKPFTILRNELVFGPRIIFLLVFIIFVSMFVIFNKS